MRTEAGAGILRAAALMIALLQASSAFANTPQECISLWGGLSKTNQMQGIAQQDFMAACLAHKVIPTPAATPQTAPDGATGLCRDGAYTTAAVPLAGCNDHGGLAALLRP